MDEGARFASLGARAGHYESFYLKACPPGGGRGIWLRHTVHKRPGAAPSAAIWLVLFDRAAAGPRAVKATLPAGELAAPPGAWIRVGPAEIGPGFARCAGPFPPVATSQPEAAAESAAGPLGGGAALAPRWDIAFSGEAPPCRYLPAQWLYRAPLPRTKFIAPVPDARFKGRLDPGDGSEPIELGGWTGMVGHNWGSEHAERWLWLQGNGFPAAPDAYFDAGAARVRIGPRVSPWLASGMLAIDGEEHRLGGLGAIRATAIEESPDACEFLLPGRDVVVRGRVAAPRKDFVGWVYADPRGPEHQTVNCSAADLELTVERPGRPPRRLSLPGGGAYELGMRETDHGIPIQPYPDG